MIKFHFNSFSNDVEDGLSATVYFPKCNLRCRYCYNLKGLDTDIDSLTLDQVKEQISNLKVNGICRVDYIVFSGGECTLHYKELKELIQYAKSLGFKIALYTNGIDNTQLLYDLYNEVKIDFTSIDFKIWSDSNPALIGLTPETYLRKLKATITTISNYSPYSLRTVLCKLSTSLKVDSYCECFKNLIEYTVREPKSIHISNVIINKDNYSFTEEDRLNESVSEEELKDFTKSVKQFVESNGISTKVYKHYLNT